MKECLISDSSTYTSTIKAVGSLAAQCNIAVQQMGDVFVFQANTEIESPKIHVFTAQVVDKLNNEPLPFSSVVINGFGMISDELGKIAYKTSRNSISLQTSHVGYFGLDSVFLVSKNNKIPLTPRVVGLKEVVIEGAKKSLVLPIIPEPGKLQLNHKVAAFLPGNNNNTIFNLLRLQPGILAAGEQSQDYIIWGSYKGQVHIVYDGITLFNTSSMNEELGAINPLLIKEIEVYKAGYNASVGDRANGIVNITGTNGIANKFSSYATFSNQALNAKVNVPMLKNGVLQLGVRKSFLGKEGRSRRLNNITEKAFYDFGDVNLKYHHNFKNGDVFSVTGITGNDVQKQLINFDNDSLATYKEIYKKQAGGALTYNKQWNTGASSKITAAGSSLSSSYFNNYNAKNDIDFGEKKNSNSTSSSITETSAKLTHSCVSTDVFHTEFGGGVINNTIQFGQDSLRQSLKVDSESLTRLHGYYKNNMNLGQRFTLTPGVKIEIPISTYIKPYIQPRLQVKYQINKKVNVAASAGQYAQFINEVPIVDEYGNQLFYWKIANNMDNPVVEAQHLVGGVYYQSNTFEIKAEPYFKKTKGIERFFTEVNSKSKEKVINGLGISRSYGVDLYAKKQLGKHDIWMSYTLSKTEESFNFFKQPFFTRAPQDQRHEIKSAGIFNFHPFYASANYVFGTGIPTSKKESTTNQSPNYSRLDVSLLYKFNTKKWTLETGFSVLNVFNTRNIKFNNFISRPDDQVGFLRATPLTPLVFVNIGF